MQILSVDTSHFVRLAFTHRNRTSPRRTQHQSVHGRAAMARPCTAAVYINTTRFYTNRSTHTHTHITTTFDKCGWSTVRYKDTHTHAQYIHRTHTYTLQRKDVHTRYIYPKNVYIYTLKYTCIPNAHTAHACQVYPIRSVGHNTFDSPGRVSRAHTHTRSTPERLVQVYALPTIANLSTFFVINPALPRAEIVTMTPEASPRTLADIANPPD